MKKFFTVVVVVVVLSAGLLLGKDIAAKVVVEKVFGLATGLKLKMSGLNVGILKSSVSINGLKLYNPGIFEERIMLDMPGIYVYYNLPAILKGKIHLHDMKLDLKEFIVTKNKDGKLNLDSLKSVKAQKQSDKTRPIDMRIDSLELKIGKVVYKDYSFGAGPSVKEFNINLDERYTDISDPYALISLIVVRALMNTTIASLTNFDLNALSGSVSGVVSKAGKLATETAGKATKIAGQTSKAVTDAAGKLINNMPFGGSKE
ncbi:MAG: hypothetical protein PHV77_06335 [Candidatus Omnitrophica bacterium]|jgi:hypothetical protein|nr:hypothetical protein [Candidatus Omnitrophota bacterium]